MKSAQSDRRTVWRARSFAAIALVFACVMATPSFAESQEREPKASYSDPLEPINRGIFAFNRAIDEMFLKPAARLYIAIVPEGGRVAVTNVVNNLKSPVILVNDLLQGDLDRAQTTIARFTVNTILGFGGIADVATDLGAPRHSEDFGQTAATYGVGSGPYLMLPFLGPSNVRDALGKVVDRFLDPLEYALDSDASFGCESRMAVMSAAWFVEFRQRLPWLLHVD